MSRTLLEFDDSKFSERLRLPQKTKEEAEFNGLLDSLSRPEKPSILIKPFPGLCIKVKNEEGFKSFINVCTSDEIPAPNDISHEDLIKLCMEEECPYVIPMSIGNERLETDKGGSPVPTYDVAMNKAFFEKCQKIESFWVLARTIIIDAINEKFGKNLDPKNHVVLKHRKVVGKLQQHRIEKRAPRKPEAPKTLIQEISSKEYSAPKRRSVPEKKALEYVILENADEMNIGMIVLFQIPSMSEENVSLEVSEDRIFVEDKSSNRSVNFFLPRKIDPKFVCSSMEVDILRVFLPIKEEN